MMPEEEEEELALIYRAKGLTEADARATAKRILADHDRALDTLTREELGMSKDEAGNAWVAAFTSLVMFAIGAVLPLLPWIRRRSDGRRAERGNRWNRAVRAGAAITLFTGRSAWYSGTRQMLGGLTMAAVTFAIGSLVGAGTGI